MEVDGEDGSRLSLEPSSTTLFGRGSGFTSDDRTVSRRHVLFDIVTETEFRVSFEVIGRNPIWLRSGVDGEIRTFRRFSKGEMAPGDSFCVAAKYPIWFNLKKADEFEQKDERISWSKSEIGASSGNGLDFEGVDVLGIDPVKEFGFLLMGHEFDSYTRRIVRDPKKWKWFLEETRESSDSHEDDDKEVRKKERRGTTKKRKNIAEDDDDWRGDSEDDKEMIAKARKVGRPKYRTRSKDVRKAGSKSSVQKKTLVLKQDEESEADEDDDEGFIVDEDDVDEQQINEDDVDEQQTNGDGEDEEEEFTDEDDDE